jgi:hypothetical protein
MVVDTIGIGLKATLTTRKLLILAPERERNPTFSSITFGLIIGVLTENRSSYLLFDNPILADIDWASA